jgi:ubiquinone/menaquinone biosynthesis C-methylase UbiE/uncharacterized protein YbaR (Trm112 family)
MQPMLLQNSGIFACPVCKGHLQANGDRIACFSCNVIYPIEESIPLLFVPNEGQTGDVTEIVKTFYEENPFPNYDDLDSLHSLMEKAQRGVFAHLLDEQIPGGATVLEVGCGTGQLTNFLGISWNRRVIGSDICLNSLRLAEGFRSRFGINNAAFVQMNLFRPAFRENSFDLVISNGVLHHTADPRGAFGSIARLVKPGGCIIVGLYNKIARLPTDLRRLLFRLSGNSLRFLDSHMRNPQYNRERKRAWFLDQYKHPRESKHSYEEVLQWFEDDGLGFEFLFSIPKIGPGPFAGDEKLFVPHDKGTKFSRWFTQVQMLLEGGVDGGLFIMIGRKSVLSGARIARPGLAEAAANAAGGPNLPAKSA